ncbi:hypothetical protein HKD39_00795 [Nakamurella sp. DB0629]|uniref:Glycoside hydrolase 35 catalytic domain-containing protein n=1 Tax=Nakamurella aerolata TaxID=1656892 RepID=A0A849A0W2_9ACTN|nr:hypothetical protein [Nakamurella aerolata]
MSYSVRIASTWSRTCCHAAGRVRSSTSEPDRADAGVLLPADGAGAAGQARRRCLPDRRHRHRLRERARDLPRARSAPPVTASHKENPRVPNPSRTARPVHLNPEPSNPGHDSAGRSTAGHSTAGDGTEVDGHLAPAAPSFNGLRVVGTHFELDGRPHLPITGEIHFSRLPRAQWRSVLASAKACGLTGVATYVFWNHHEPDRGTRDFTGANDLAAFVDLAAAYGLGVVLRIGPWVHGEARYGGFPDWVQDGPWQTRTDDSDYLAVVGEWYAAIAAELGSCRRTDHIMAIQVENELRTQPAHLATLRRLAEQQGLRAPVWTATGWGAAEFDRSILLPVYGGYSDAFWTSAPLGWESACAMSFSIQPDRDDTIIGADFVSALPQTPGRDDSDLPYATCELGGGMAVAYHRRPVVDPADIGAMATAKLGCGSVWHGYYVFHGGTATGAGRRTAPGDPQHWLCERSSVARLRLSGADRRRGRRPRACSTAAAAARRGHRADRTLRHRGHHVPAAPAGELVGRQHLSLQYPYRGQPGGRCLQQSSAGHRNGGAAGRAAAGCAAWRRGAGAAGTGDGTWRRLRVLAGRDRPGRRGGAAIGQCAADRPVPSGWRPGVGLPPGGGRRRGAGPHPFRRRGATVAVGADRGRSGGVQDRNGARSRHHADGRQPGAGPELVPHRRRADPHRRDGAAGGGSPGRRRGQRPGGCRPVRAAARGAGGAPVGDPAVDAGRWLDRRPDGGRRRRAARPEHRPGAAGNAAVVRVRAARRGRAHSVGGRGRRRGPAQRSGWRGLRRRGRLAGRAATARRTRPGRLVRGALGRRRRAGRGQRSDDRRRCGRRPVLVAGSAAADRRGRSRRCVQRGGGDSGATGEPLAAGSGAGR